MNPPSENPQFIKIDDSNFYYATTSSTQYSVEDIKANILGLQDKLSYYMNLLSDASSAGVAQASVKLNEILSINNTEIKL